MPDREKVIKGLEICTSPESCRSECPYYEKEGATCSYWLLKDALELLNGQEKVMPNSTIEQNVAGGSWWFSCGNCGEQIDYKDKFCRHCGREVKWDGNEH